MFSIFLLSLQLTGLASVIDGDTIEIRDQRIRLYGIDAPEGNQICLNRYKRKYRCGQKAALALYKLINQQTITCFVLKKDLYNRSIAICKIKRTKQDINRFMVKEGYAIAYRKYSKKYIMDENSARKKKIGLWQGKFLSPSKWRKR